LQEFQFWVDLECLNLGIISNSVTSSGDRGSINAALSLLSPEEARVAKRKFRKLAKKSCKKKKDIWEKMTRRQKRNSVVSLLYRNVIIRLHDWNKNDDGWF
jgi:hypothetical protein